eukprot:GHVP01028277.1.p1 GENE.GHVP01028277.1~~GHVP01028277.1.p1  ORF type:complete len:368 (-),score=45.16 GHVP01028277.1:2390-3493(-)
MARKEILFFFPFSSGFFVVIISSMNGRLAEIIRSSIWSSVAQKGLGSIFTAIVLTIQCAIIIWRRIPLTLHQGCQNLVKDLKADWKNILMLMSPVTAGIYTFCSVAFPLEIGSAAFFICVVTGQVTGSVVVDLTGIMWNKKSAITVVGWFGLLLVIAGSFIFQIPSFVVSNANIFFLLLSFLAGSVRIVTASLNKKMHSYLNYIFATTTYALFGTTIVLLIPTPFVQKPQFQYLEPSDWWLFLSFIFGIYSSIINMLIPKRIGYSVHYCAIIAGQLVGSVLVDSLGWMKSEKIAIDVYRISGLVVCITGVLIMQFLQNNSSEEVAQDEMSTKDRSIENKKVFHGMEVKSSDSTLPTNPIDISSEETE